LPWPADPPAAPTYARLASIAALGQRVFFDPTLSASGKMACATCHDPAHGFAAPDAAAVRLGGPAGDKPGIRTVPGLTYLARRPVFTEHFYESEEDGDESLDQGPAGGLTWDGRVDTVRDQALIPLFAPEEMANSNPHVLAERLRSAPYAPTLRTLFGSTTNDDATVRAARVALDTYLQQPGTFSPYTSKYDAYLRGTARMTEAEARGLAAFNDPERGDCIRCHRSEPNAAGVPPPFADYGMSGLGLPRNMAIPANKDPTFFDLGLCGPVRTDLSGNPAYCGLFRTPSLRNVALKASFFHNGVIHSLRDAVAFYAERDLKPEAWYPRGSNGLVMKFDDLPRTYWDNIDREAPFDRKPGDRPALTAQEIDDVTAFLRTLTDGYKAP
jgi:cytochrome c peroxidase